MRLSSLRNQALLILAFLFPCAAARLISRISHKKAKILTLDVQVHALLVAPDPAERLAVEAAQVGQPHAADGQHRLAVATPHLKAAILTLGTQTKKTHQRHW